MYSYNVIFLLIFCGLESANCKDAIAWMRGKGCDCSGKTDNYPFNFSCIQECYLHYSENSSCIFDYETFQQMYCESFIKSFLKLRSIHSFVRPNGEFYQTPFTKRPLIGPKHVVSVIKFPRETVISLSAETQMRFGFYGLNNFTCNLQLASLKKETDFLRKCFHYSDV